jgi:TIR domain
MNGPRSNGALARRIARVLRQALEQGATVEIDGLGKFVPDGRRGARGVRFVGQTKPRVFIAYVQEDLSPIRKLYRAFEQHGFRPWLDKKKLLPGQNWPRAIETAIQTSDFFVACFSRRATSKRGSFHSELRFALNCAARVPLDEIFFIPLRLDDCIVPRRISRQVQYLDLFPEWEAGVSRVIAAIRAQDGGRKRKRPKLAG